MPRDFSANVYERPGIKVWWGRVYVEGEAGKKHRFSTFIEIGDDKRKSRRVAKRVAEERGRQIAARTADSPAPSESRYTLGGISKRMIAQKVADGRRPRAVDSLAWYVDKHSLPFFSPARDVRTVRRADLEAFKAKLRGDGHSPQTINNALTGIRQILKHAWRIEELIDSVPMVANVPVDKTPKGRALTAEQVERLFANLDPRAVEARHFLVLVANTGLRKSEALAVRFSWVDWRRRLLIIPAEFTKGGRPRQPVALNRAALDVLRERKKLHARRVDRDDDRVFRQLKHDEARNSAARRAGLGRVRNHDLRHTIGSLHVQAGATLTEARDTLGHSTMAMVSHYQHGYIERRQAIADKVVLGTAKPRSATGGRKKKPKKSLDDT